MYHGWHPYNSRFYHPMYHPQYHPIHHFPFHSVGPMIRPGYHPSHTIHHPHPTSSGGIGGSIGGTYNWPSQGTSSISTSIGGGNSISGGHNYGNNTNSIGISHSIGGGFSLGFGINLSNGNYGPSLGIPIGHSGWGIGIGTNGIGVTAPHGSVIADVIAVVEIFSFF